MTQDEPMPIQMFSTVREELASAGLSGEALARSITRIEAEFFLILARTVRDVTLVTHKSKHADKMRQWRSSRKAKRDDEFKISTDLLALKPIDAALGHRPHNPLGQKSGHIARRHDVTRTIMGDPEPGRSALDRRKT
jgi:hypothetical protein